MIDIYLASPYTHPDPNVREARFQIACKAAAELIKMGFSVFSPIAHSHPIALHGVLDPVDGDMWLDQCLAFIPHCEKIFALDIDGIEVSEGFYKETLAGFDLGKSFWNCWFEDNEIRFSMCAVTNDSIVFRRFTRLV